MQYPVELFVAVIAAGAFTGTALLPLKYARGWKFENTWLLFAALAYLMAPWLVAALSVPHLISVYADVGLRVCVLTAVFGFGWGLAVVLNGIGVATIGISLASTILMGSSISLGSLFPMLLSHRAQLATRQGETILALDLLMLAGVLLCAQAGKLRAGGREVAVEDRSVAMRGIVICLAAGLLSTLLNVALAYGAPIAQAATARGASPYMSTNAIWAVAIGAGSLPSLLWCITGLFRGRDWTLFRQNNSRNALLCMLMASLWISGTVIYGAAANMLGELGTAIGWPIYMSGIILTSNICGWLTGEWRGVRGAPAYYMSSGVAVQVLTILALGWVR